MRIERKGFCPHRDAAAGGPSCAPRSVAPRLARRRRAGFSLVELLVVVAIIGLLASIVALNLGGASTQARQQKAAADLENIKKAIMIYKEDTSEYPRDLRDLIEDSGATGWGKTSGGEPYLDEDPVDPWGNPYEYGSPDPWGNRKFNARSLGAQGQDGGEDDQKDIYMYEPR